MGGLSGGWQVLRPWLIDGRSRVQQGRLCITGSGPGLGSWDICGLFRTVDSGLQRVASKPTSFVTAFFTSIELAFTDLVVQNHKCESYVWSRSLKSTSTLSISVYFLIMDRCPFYMHNNVYFPQISLRKFFIHYQKFPYFFLTWVWLAQKNCSMIMIQVANSSQLNSR